MGFFDVFLPTLDVYGDASLVIPWYYQGHYAYASLMTAPMILNYIFTAYKWWSMEKASDKKWSWVLVMLQLWQQWNAFKVMRLIYKKDDRAEEKKKRTLKELSSIEPFFESVPSILIMTGIWLYAVDYDLRNIINTVDCSNTTSNTARIQYEKNWCAVFDGLGGPAWFFTTYAVSILAGSFGICKFLQNGPVAILPTNLMNWPFVRGFFAVLFSLVAKGLFFPDILIGLDSNYRDTSTHLWLHPLIFITINILPNLILSLIGVSLKTGWNKKLIKTLLDYPAFMVLPAFTNFAVGPKQLTCSKFKNSEQELTVSGNLTAINTLLTLICYAITIGILTRLSGNPELEFYFGAMFSPVLSMSLLCILLFYLFDRYKKCCKRFIGCLCCCVSVLVAVLVIAMIYVNY